MVPAATALAQTAAQRAHPLRLHLRPARCGHGVVDSGGCGSDFELSPTLKTLEAFKTSDGRHQQSETGGRSGRDARCRSERLAERRGPEANRGGRPRLRHVDRSGAGTAGRAVVAVSLARVRHGGFHRLRWRMHAGIQLRVSRRDRLGVADAAAPDGDQPAWCLRAAVRRRRQRRAASRQPARGPQHPGRHSQRHARAADAARRARPRASGHLPAGRARDRAADSAQRGAAARRRHVREAARHPRLIRGAWRADDRPARAGVSDRADACLHVHDVARGQPAHLRDRLASPTRGT